eukprot:COSAG04_NODE_7362_length_1140_cov_1.170029_1_plen_31_part_10
MDRYAFHNAASKDIAVDLLRFEAGGAPLLRP